MNKKLFYVWIALSILLSVAFSPMGTIHAATNKPASIYSSVPNFVKKFNNEQSASSFYHIKKYDVKTVNGVKQFSATFDDTTGGYKLFGEVNPDHSLKNLTFQSDMYYADKYNPELEDGVGDIGIERLLIVITLVHILNPQAQVEQVQKQVIALINQVPKVNPGKKKKTISGKVTANGLTYSINVPQNVEVFTLRITK
ncbi:hypothetical protein [Paenibacillus campi]|uniref:hypothetical protein n=1 Tax=Paenibacillus campi TaxID=3106031 RepID=UPI002AFE498E|nr:hypothetical protein [Paenibacillus sp. SGZ-1009]